MRQHLPGYLAPPENKGSSVLSLFKQFQKYYLMEFAKRVAAQEYAAAEKAAAEAIAASDIALANYNAAAATVAAAVEALEVCKAKAEACSSAVYKAINVAYKASIDVV